MSGKPRLTRWHNLGWIRAVFGLQTVRPWYAFTALLPGFTILYRCTKTSLTRIPGATHLPNGRWKSRMWPGELNRPFISLRCGPVSLSAGQQMGMRMQLKHNPDMSRWYLPEQNRQPTQRGVSQRDGSTETHRNKPIKLLLNIFQTVNYVYLYITSDCIQNHMMKKTTSWFDCIRLNSADGNTQICRHS